MIRIKILWPLFQFILRKINSKYKVMTKNCFVRLSANHSFKSERDENSSQIIWFDEEMVEEIDCLQIIHLNLKVIIT